MIDHTDNWRSIGDLAQDIVRDLGRPRPANDRGGSRPDDQRPKEGDRGAQEIETIALMRIAHHLERDDGGDPSGSPAANGIRRRMGWNWPDIIGKRDAS